VRARAEAFVIFKAGSAGQDALTAARRAAPANGGIELESRPGRVHIVAGLDGTGIEALALATRAALALIEALKDESAVLEGARRLSMRKPAERSLAARGKPKPQILMGEVSAPRPGPDNRREAFRNFMTGRRLRPSQWAKDAGVPSGEILAFLTGRSRGFSAGVAEKLAHAAKVRVEDLFR
jgi:hypothetical protein